MPFAENEGVQIRYEVEGKGPPLVLHHGFVGFLETWDEKDHGPGQLQLLVRQEHETLATTLEAMFGQ